MFKFPSYLLVNVLPGADVFSNFLLGQPPLFSEKLGNLFRVVGIQDLVLDQHLDPFFGVVVELSDASDEQVFLWITSTLVFGNHPGVYCVIGLQKETYNYQLPRLFSNNHFKT